MLLKKRSFKSSALLNQTPEMPANIVVNFGLYLVKFNALKPVCGRFFFFVLCLFAAEVCAIFKVTKPTIYDWIKHGKLKPYKIRSRVYFLWNDIQQLIPCGSH